MGTKVTIFVIFNLVLLNNIIYGQTKEDKIKLIKKYAFCNCIYINNNRLDTNYLTNKFQLNDKSSNQFINLGKISDFESQKIREYTEEETKDFTTFESEYYSENGKSNTITAKCLEFYESQKLDTYIKKILDTKPKKITKKKK